MSKQIKITAQNCVFRGQTVSKGDVIPTKNFPSALTADEIGVMVPRLGSLVKEGETPEETPEEKPAAKKAAKKTAKKKN